MLRHLIIAGFLITMAAAAHAQESAPEGVLGEIQGGNGCVLDEAAAQFETRKAEGPQAEVRMSLGDLTLTLYPRQPGAETPEGELPLEFLTIARHESAGGESCEHIIADANVFIVWARPAMPDGYSAAEPAPLAILSSYSGGAHCCTTLYALYPGKEVKLQVLEIGNAEAQLTQEWAGGPPDLSFGDDSFAYWNTSYAGSPGGGVTLHWSPDGYRLSDQMKGDAPPEAELTRIKDEMRQLLLDFGGPYTAIDAPGDRPQTKGELDPAIWANLLDLIYRGQTALAAKTFDEAWPPEVKGKRIFWRDFLKQMEATWIWEPWNLKGELDPEMTFAHGE